METIRKVESSLKLNTKGCCFLCLKTENIKQIEKLEGSQILQSISIQTLLLHLQITAQSLNEALLVRPDFKKEDIQVDLCESCEEIISRFSVLFQELEKIQLEMDYFLERIHKCILQSAKAPDLVQNYSKRMTSDLEALSQLAFVDNLRKEVAKESSRKVNVPRLQLIVTRANSKLIKTEITNEEFESNDGDFPGNNFTEDCSPASSPNSTENHEEDQKGLTISTSFSSGTLPEKLSPSFKPPVKRKSNVQYYTKDLSTGMFNCKKCYKKSKARKTIVDHFKTIHLKIRHKCDFCNSLFTQLGKLSQHKRTCRQNQEKKLAKENDPRFKFICKICGKRFAAKRNLAIHRIQVHKNIGRYPCDLCNKKFKCSRSLNEHRDAVHLGIKFNCGFCSKSFSYKSDMRTHEMKCAKKSALKKEPGEEELK